MSYLIIGIGHVRRYVPGDGIEDPGYHEAKDSYVEKEFATLDEAKEASIEWKTSFNEQGGSFNSVIIDENYKIVERSPSLKKYRLLYDYLRTKLFDGDWEGKSHSWQ